MAQNDWADPSPAGIVGLCTVVIPLCAVILGWAPKEAIPLLTAWQIIGGLVQVIAGLIEFRRGGMVFATAFLVFGLILCIEPALATLLAPTAAPFLQGVGFLIVAAFVFCFFFTVGLVSNGLFVACLLLDLGLWLVGLSFLGVGGPGLATAGAWALLIFALFMLYVSIAIFVNTAFNGPILSIGKPLFRPKQ